MNNSRAEIMASLQKASSLAEQIALVSELEALDARQASNIAEDRSLDFTSAIVEQTLSPVRVHEFHTASTDWLSMDDDTQDNNYHQAVMAEASLWFNRISDEVKNDVPEFVEQARGIARRTASTYGVYAPDAEQSFLQYVAFLNREAASGLDQVDQLIDPNNMPKATEYPAATFPTFEDPVHPINDQAVAQEGTYNNPLLAEIEQLGGGQGQGEWPPVPGGGTANFANVTSVAISHSYNLDEFRQREAASTLDQIAQTIDPNNMPKPTPLPGEVAYPWMLGGPVVDPEADDQDFTQAAPAAIDKAVAATKTAAKIQWYDEGGIDPNGGDDPLLHSAETKDRDGNFAFGHIYQSGDDPNRIFTIMGNENTHDDQNQHDHESVADAKAHINEHLRGYLPGRQHEFGFTGSRRIAAPADFSCRSCDATGKTKDGKNSCGNCGGMGMVPAEVNAPKNASRKTAAEATCDNCGAAGAKPSVYISYGNPNQTRWSCDDCRGPFLDGIAPPTASRKTADMYGNSDAPHAVAQPDVANSPATTPQPQQGGSYTAGFAAGMADGANGDAPTYSDASSGLAFSSGYVAGYQKGIGEARDERNPKDMPYSAGGDNGQAFLSGTAGRNPFRRKGPAADLPTDVSKLHLNRPGKYIDDETLPYSQRYESDQIWRGNSPSPKHAPENNKDLERQLDEAQAQRTSSLFTPEDANQDPEFRKAYKFASKWDASKPLVRTGSAEFEAGLYAGISDNIGSQEAWVAKHRKQANKYPEFSQRIALHKDFSLKVISDQGGIMKGAYLRVESATSTDLDTMAPDATPSPVGETPINGPGRDGPNAGGTDPARPGGPAPYNGVEPFGQGVINAEINVSMPATQQLTSARRLANFRQAIEDNISLVTKEN